MGILSFNGDLTFESGSVFAIEIAPLTNSRAAVTGNAILAGNGDLLVYPSSGFYGLSATYTLLTTTGTVTAPFASPASNPFPLTDPNFIGTLSYNTNNIQLFVQVLNPFQYFPFANGNEQAVGTNLDILNSSGSITADMAAVINSLAGQSDAAINSALDQLHPAAMSAFAEQQTELGGQLLSLFHRSPFLICGCSQPSRLWVEPFGNWLKEKPQGEQIGFDTTTRGIAFGYDLEFLGCWTIGIGGAWNESDLSWALDRGRAYSKGLYGSFYTDFVLNNFYLGGSAYAGHDWFATARHIEFTTNDRTAKAHFGGADIAGQLTAAYFFGTPSALLYPYGTVDYLYLDEESFSESGADSLDLSVSGYTSQTLRTEAGIAFQFIDKNYRETACISPLIAFGWVMNLPLSRDHYSAIFAGQEIPFKVQGWNETWQLLNLRFGLGIVYRCFTLDSQYNLDISPEGGSPLFNQRANFRLSRSF